MVTITPAAPVHVEEAAAVLARAFEKDALMTATIGGRPDERLTRLTHLFRATVRDGLRRGVVDLARSDTGADVWGVAVWGAPTRRRLGLPHPVDLASYLRAVHPSNVTRALAVERSLAAARPGEPHWFLAAIGVHEDGRGRGVGSALLESRLARIDQVRQPAPAYLEASTERAAALYARFGFVASEKVTGIPSEVAPISMWRTPPARATGEG
ncbi:GNAT family N-acetyltransferase [Cellulomonas bogoriensis]|uniref:GNAT family acetyltransferase n=1 Tax=Cellulomonas bogoriensis 69B4 = DSM 16987 TaxID=1386082 RepID=A0A0A0BU20_9CELL|nr:GNAT family N-acetyltransferase [Cellulomonas bogoriensis]KGM11465.1 GNAT family acetyltransferase [Cellulomonas bogoriensis 69B4 = DSM 16987]